MTPEIEKRIKAVRVGRQLNVRQEMKKIEDIFEETCEKNHPDAEVLTIIQGVGTVPREQSGREIIYDKNSLASYKYVKKGDFIIHLRSFEGGLEVANSDGIVSPAYIILHPKIEVSTIYLYALFHTNRFINQTMAPAVEGARDGRSVKYDILKKQKIPFPPLSEQKKIAEILATQDRVIELKEKLIAEKQSQKKYLMQTYLMKKKHSPLFQKKWKRIYLSEILKERRECNELENLRICSVAVNNGVVDQKEHLGKSMAAENTSNYAVVHYGDIVYTKSPTGAFPYGIIKQSQLKEDVAVSPLYGVYEPYCYEIGYLLQVYFSYANNANNYLKPIVNKGAKNTILISNQTFLKPSLYLPIDIEEIKYLYMLFKSTDEEISLLQKDLEQEKLKKKSLMQLLLTGLVRVA